MNEKFKTCFDQDKICVMTRWTNVPSEDPKKMEDVNGKRIAKRYNDQNYRIDINSLYIDPKTLSPLENP